MSSIGTACTVTGAVIEAVLIRHLTFFQHWQLALISSIAPASSHTAAGHRVIGSAANSTACHS